MNREEFWKYYNNKEYDKLRSVFKEDVQSQFGFDIDTYARQASWGKDFDQLFFLWQIGAKASTPYMEQIFEKFTKGGTAQELRQERQNKKNEKLRKVKADLTNYQSVNQLIVSEVDFTTNEQNQSFLVIRFAPFLYDGEVFDSESCLFGPLNFKGLRSKKKFDFSNSNFGESIYLFNAHNPVNLFAIEFDNVLESEIRVKITLQFDFEFEGSGKNELLALETTTHKKMFMQWYNE